MFFCLITAYFQGTVSSQALSTLLGGYANLLPSVIDRVRL